MENAMSTATRKTSSRSKTSTGARGKSTRRWSKHVTETSHALDLQEGVFSRKDPKSIARSLKRSAEASHRRKADPYRSAMSMITFYVNRAGGHLPAAQRKRLEASKEELRRLYHR
jgi:hypothetical protein